ncbi:hypothetical protein [Microterricola viridarii]|uniref:Uncharacterized protein n=1 Tax=Microterricola viridarii TaxID=412690 RepID=A0A109QWT1_9MICO|nr:hypothetical protein [Microterricola viridarii]AMB58685.1 hypothetical protein AWU67_07205 [Microterricola viridarii]
MRAWFTLVGAALGALLAVWALANVLPAGYEVIPRILYAIIVFGGAVGGLGVRKHNEKRNRAADADSVEHQIAIQARAGSFVDGLVIAAAFGLYLVLTAQFETALLVYGLLCVSIGLFWARYAILRRGINQAA